MYVCELDLEDLFHLVDLFVVSCHVPVPIHVPALIPVKKLNYFIEHI